MRGISKINSWAILLVLFSLIEPVNAQRFLPLYHQNTNINSTFPPHLSGQMFLFEVDSVNNKIYFMGPEDSHGGWNNSRPFLFEYSYKNLDTIISFKKGNYWYSINMLNNNDLLIYHQAGTINENIITPHLYLYKNNQLLTMNTNSINFSYDLTVSGAAIYRNELFVLYVSSQGNSTNYNQWFMRYDTTLWSSMIPEQNSFIEFGKMINYKDSLLVIAHDGFYNPPYCYFPSPWVMAYNGDTLISMAGLNGWVRDFEIYKGELYACGDFNYTGTDSSYNIAKWDGVRWKQIKPGFQGFDALGVGGGGQMYMSDVNDMTVINDKLYIGGLFRNNRRPFRNDSRRFSHNIAVWDGNLMNYSTDSCFGQGGLEIEHLGSFRNELTVCANGNTDYNPCDSNIYYNYMVMYTSDTTWLGLKNNKEVLINNIFTIYPNPSNGIFELSFNEEINLTSEPTLINIINGLGQVVKNIRFAGNQRMMIDLSAEPKGIYFIRVQAGDFYGSKKLIIE